MYPLTRLIFYLVQMFFVFNLLNFRYFNEKLTGEKRIKEPNSDGMAQEEISLQGEREKGRKEELLPKFMILSIQRCSAK